MGSEVLPCALPKRAVFGVAPDFVPRSQSEPTAKKVAPWDFFLSFAMLTIYTANDRQATAAVCSQNRTVKILYVSGLTRTIR